MIAESKVRIEKIVVKPVLTYTGETRTEISALKVIAPSYEKK